MAIVTKQTSGQTWKDASEITTLLAPFGVKFEQWDVSRLARTPRQEGESDQDHVLRVFEGEVARISAENGYQAADVVSLSPAMPNLSELLAKFDKEHYHTEDEVRFVVSGRGVFSVRGTDGEMYDIEVHPGDLLAVPDGTYHYFDLCEDRHIQCIRLFTDKGGWVAHYVEPAAN
jgi:1,2-dihydroxy-3-keto-5-methylthiopentene dioxygenase